MIAHMAAALIASMGMTQQMDTTFAVSGSGQLDLQNHEGTVTVSTWDRDELRIRANWDDGERPVAIRAAGSTVRVRVQGRYGLPRVEFDITAPRGMSIALQGVELAVTIDGSAGNISVNSVEGAIDVTGGSGNVAIQAVDGDVRVREARGNIAVHAIEGDVSVVDSRGTVRVESVEGDVDLLNIDSENVGVNVVDGDVTFRGAIHDGGRYFMSTHDGDLDITVPANANARVSIATFDGELVSDIPIQIEGDFSQKRFSFTLGTGRALIELSSFDGVIRLQKSP
ncbi:MAG: DUF4097 domain-containing protein [Gemmatimonadota bacterium]|nr:DUF4097 domain-containing protein [Gemmatimonadota bacterium]